MARLLWRAALGVAAVLIVKVVADVAAEVARQYREVLAQQASQRGDGDHGDLDQ